MFGFSDIAPVLAALPALVSLIAGLYQGPGRERREIESYSRILGNLPDGPARDKLLALLAQRIDVAADLSRRRDVPMLVVSLILAPALWLFSVWLFRIDTVWGILGGLVAAVAALLFTYGIFETAQKIPRDDKGHATRPGVALLTLC